MLLSLLITSRRLTERDFAKAAGERYHWIFNMTAMPHLLAACSRKVLIDHLDPMSHIPPCGNLLYALHNAHMPDPAAKC